MSSQSAPSYRRSRVLVWVLFVASTATFVMFGLVLGGQGMDHLGEDATRTIGRGELITAGACLTLGPMTTWVLRDLSLAIFGYHDQVMALRRDMNAIVNRSGSTIEETATRPPAPWTCGTCSSENGMNDLACRSCGTRYAT